MINLVTAVSRPENLRRIHRSICASLARSSLNAKWILVTDGPGVIPPKTEALLKEGPFEVVNIIHLGGACSYGINQKNAGLDSLTDGYFHCIDDDNIVHPDFFPGIERAIRANPRQRAFVFGQKRWDNIKSLTASADRMVYGKVDNTMFVVHTSLIGAHRYDLSRSGREDFLFFRNLYDLHRDEFVFIPDTLAYYNFIRHFPNETPEEKRPIPTPATRPAWAPNKELLAAVRSASVLKIALYSAKRDRCGISTYTEHLADALSLLGHEVKYFSCLPPYEPTLEEIVGWRPDVLHVQHETSIVPPDQIMERYLGFLVAQGTRVIFTLHTATQAAAQLASRISGPRKSVITHRPSDEAKGSIVVPMPCTNLAIRSDRSDLREAFGFPKDAFIVSTVGFMIAWKAHAEIAEALADWMAKDRSVHLQIIASEHFNESLRGYAQECRARLSRLAARFPEGRMRHIDGYPSDLELVERLSISNLGYVWCPFDTSSSSAAGAQFITARCPLVASASTHYDLMGDGVLRAPKTDVAGFARLIQKTAGDAELLKKLEAGQRSTYKDRNYLMTAMKHLEIYERKDL